ncbi:hypothetical protein LCGC14_3124640 [marine sediment metagenome]|uniref:Uncharacterized protein n=1 Tax=marine sediment metagenome TaxID=412755 RepID=A0A0F8W1A2_9ZZZZ
MKQLTMDDVQRIVGGLTIENTMLREALAKAQQTVKVDADKGDTSKRGASNKPRPLNAV